VPLAIPLELTPSQSVALALAGIVVGLAFVVVFLNRAMGGKHASSRAMRALDTWAHRNGYRIDSAEDIRETYFYSRNPFGGFRPLGAPSEWNEFTTSHHQFVYRISATSFEGEPRDGWARIGGFIVGQNRRRVEVIWEDDVLMHNLQ
jgi:hypothetical protein